MSRTVVVSGVVVGLIVLASMFAPAPSVRAAQRHSGSASGPGSGSSGGPGGGSGSGSGQAPACRGLRNALNACLSNPGSHNGCAHIREQLIAQGCGVGSSGSGILSGSGSGRGSR